MWWIIPLLFVPCTYDDGTGAPCYWDAQSMGNGTGTSYVLITDDQPLYLR